MDLEAMACLRINSMSLNKNSNNSNSHSNCNNHSHSHSHTLFDLPDDGHDGRRKKGGIHHEARLMRHPK